METLRNFIEYEIFRIENVKSDIRKVINEKFIEHNIAIPFPQLDLHLVSNKTGSFDQKMKIKPGVNNKE